MNPMQVMDPVDLTDEVARDLVEQVDKQFANDEQVLTARDRLICRYFIGPGRYMKALTTREIQKAGLKISYRMVDVALRKLDAQSYIEYLQWEMVSQAKVTPEELTRRAACILRASISDFFVTLPDGRVVMKNLHSLPEELKYALKKIKMKRTSTGRGESRVWEEVAEIELESRAPIMAMLSEWLNMKERGVDLTKKVAKIAGLNLIVAKGNSDDDS